MIIYKREILCWLSSAICERRVESVDHLLLHCKVAGSVGFGLVKEIWRLVPLCVMWCIWREKCMDI
jgi:hypothetical protein